jgi:hypothetical protein
MEIWWKGQLIFLKCTLGKRLTRFLGMTWLKLEVFKICINPKGRGQLTFQWQAVSKSPKINTHTLVLLIKIYSTDISAQKHANTLSICLIWFTYSPIHQSRHNFVFFRNYTVLGGHSRKLVSEPIMFAQLTCRQRCTAYLSISHTQSNKVPQLDACNIISFRIYKSSKIGLSISLAEL